MKKFFVAAAVALCLMTSSYVYAEDAAQEKSVEELEGEIGELKNQMNELMSLMQTMAGTGAGQQETADSTVEGIETVAETGAAQQVTGNGRRLMQNETANVSEWGSVTVFNVGFSDTVQAKNAAADSLVLTASAGKTFFLAEIGFAAFNKEITVGNALSCKLIVDGVVYNDGWKLLLSKGRDGVEHNAWNHSFSSMRDGYTHLFNTIDSNIPVYGGSELAVFYYAEELPAELASESSDASIILQLDVNGTPFYYQVR